MPHASQKITEFPGTAETNDTVTPLPVDFITQDRDPTREIRAMIEDLQVATREARRRQRQAEDEREQFRVKVLDLQAQVESGAKSSGQMKALIQIGRAHV